MGKMGKEAELQRWMANCQDNNPQALGMWMWSTKGVGMKQKAMHLGLGGVGGYDEVS